MSMRIHSEHITEEEFAESMNDNEGVDPSDYSLILDTEIVADAVDPVAVPTPVTASVVDEAPTPVEDTGDLPIGKETV